MNTTTYTTRKTTVTSRHNEPNKSPRPPFHLEMIGDQDVVLFDGIAPRSLVRQFQALIELHNSK